MASRVAQPVGERLWIIDGGVVRFYGMPFTTRMAVARLEDGGLWLWSPIALDDEVRRAVEALGEPRYAVEPNKLHHLALAEWVRAWPRLRLHAPPGLAAKRPDLTFAGALGDEPPAEWRGEIDQLVVAGSAAVTEVLFFHRPSSTCLVGDLIQKHDLAALTGWQRLVARAGGVAGNEGSTPLDWRLTFFRRERARASLARALAWAPRHLVIAHGASAMDDGAAVMRRSLGWLFGDRGDRPA